MKKNYEAPNAEVISFTSLEQLANLKVELVEENGLGGTITFGSRSDF